MRIWVLFLAQNCVCAVACMKPCCQRFLYSFCIPDCYCRSSHGCKDTALEVCTNRFPKIGRYWQHKMQRCIVHMTKKQTTPQIWNLDWKYRIISTMAGHWKTKLESWTKILCINSASFESLVLCYRSCLITFSCCHDHLLSSTILFHFILTWLTVTLVFFRNIGQLLWFKKRIK